MGPMAPKVKICGLTNLDDARRAADLGAWALGLIFHEPSPRACAESEALEIAAALHRRALVCGVFVNRPLDEVVAAADRIGLTMLQLHGDEGPAYCAEAARRTGCRVVKAVQVRTQADLQAVEAFHTDFHMLDAPARGLRGGTGETFDWDLLRGSRWSCTAGCPRSSRTARARSSRRTRCPRAWTTPARAPSTPTCATRAGPATSPSRTTTPWRPFGA